MLDDLKKAIKAELRLQVTVWDPEDDTAEHTFSSFIIEGAGSMMRIAPPVEDADTIIPLMKKGFVVGVVMETYPTPYIFYPIIHNDPSNPADGIWLMIPSNTEIEVFHRRRHVRIPMEVPIDLEFANGAMTVSMPGRTIDVSGGGLMFNSQRCFPKDETLIIYLQFDLEQPRMMLPAKVVLSRENRMPKRVEDQFSTAVQFVELDAAKEMLLVRECFRCELRRKQKHR
jgi:c-di-GMP-binding flagellar brake protein YcgR